MRQLVALVLVLDVAVCAASGRAQIDKSSFRVIGYYSLRAAMAADPASVPFDKLTHINLSFLNPDPAGSFAQDLLGLAPFVAVALAGGLDGIDVDLEGRDIDEHYEAFVTDLGKALRARQKLMTSAIAVFYKDSLTDGALAQYDFVNIMSYDHTGPWRPEKPGPHAPYAEAEAALSYFGADRHIPQNKLVLGVPFYGYGFGPDRA